MRAKVVSSADDGAAWNHRFPSVITILCVLMLRAQFLQTHCVFSIYEQPDFGPRPFLGFPVPCGRLFSLDETINCQLRYTRRRAGTLRLAASRSAALSLQRIHFAYRRGLAVWDTQLCHTYGPVALANLKCSLTLPFRQLPCQIGNSIDLLSLPFI